MRKAYIIAGLAYGDEGKGATVDFLTRKSQASLVVRYNGGAQAAHNVVTVDGKHHTFAQFGSGTLAGARTHLSRFMMINPADMFWESQHLATLGIRNPVGLVTADPWALITTPFHRYLNRLEQLSTGANNTCGMGIGWTKRLWVKYGECVLFAKDLSDEKLTREKLKFIQKICIEEKDKLTVCFKDIKEAYNYERALEDPKLAGDYADYYVTWPVKLVDDRFALDGHETIIFEGSQGVLLDEDFGESGFNTWSDTTFRNANTILREGKFEGTKEKVGVLRTYLTRHGDGSFRTESSSILLEEEHNENEGCPGKFRYGYMDTELINKAIDFCHGVDWIALNHLDQINFENFKFKAEIRLKGYGPTAEDRKWVKGDENEKDAVSTNGIVATI